MFYCRMTSDDDAFVWLTCTGSAARGDWAGTRSRKKDGLFRLWKRQTCLTLTLAALYLKCLVFQTWDNTAAVSKSFWSYQKHVSTARRKSRFNSVGLDICWERKARDTHWPYHGRFQAAVWFYSLCEHTVCSLYVPSVLYFPHCFLQLVTKAACSRWSSSICW